MTVDNATGLLTALHSNLAPLNGFIGLAPTDATYPLVTYTIVSSGDSPSKCFTTQGNEFDVQFSYWDSGSFLNCLTLAANVEAVLAGLGYVLQVSKGNIQMVQDTKKSELFQIVDLRTIEVLKEITPIS